MMPTTIAQHITPPMNQQRELHAALMSAISDALVAVDHFGIPIFENSRFSDLFPRPLGMDTLWTIFEEAGILDVFEMALEEGLPGSVKVIPTWVDGQSRYYSLSVSALKSSDGDIYGALGIFHDVTELKKAEQIRIDFVANVSHELRTPLTAIKGYTDTVREDIIMGRAVEPEFVEIIARNAGRLMSLINDLLDLSLLDANADQLERGEVSTEELTSRVAKQMSARIENRKQTLTVLNSAPRLWADPARLEQVVLNLLDNAHKYTPEGGRLTLSWEPTPEGGGVFLKVSDSGPGIAPEHHARLFERFYRVDKARSRDMGGTGLGLAIVKHIVQRHGGTIELDSQLGAGATFICRFPRRRT